MTMIVDESFELKPFIAFVYTLFHCIYILVINKNVVL